MIRRIDRRENLLNKLEELPPGAIVCACYTYKESTGGDTAGAHISRPRSMTVGDARALLFEIERMKLELLGIASDLEME